MDSARRSVTMRILRNGGLIFWVSASLVTRAGAQSGAMAQDSLLDNLQHDAAYRPARLGTLGQVVRKGSGSLDVLIIAGWGFGASAFEEFMTSNSERYRMVAVTLPGFGGTAAPPMPPANTSYSEGTWTRAAE